MGDGLDADTQTDACSAEVVEAAFVDLARSRIVEHARVSAAFHVEEECELAGSLGCADFEEWARPPSSGDVEESCEAARAALLR